MKIMVKCKGNYGFYYNLSIKNSCPIKKNAKMWNTVILPIITSMTATGLGILFVWIFNRKRQSDERANQIAHIMNEISDIRNKVANGLERSALETAKNEKLRQEVKEEVENIKQDVKKIDGDLEKINGDLEKINTQVSENTNLIRGLINVVAELQIIIRDNISSQS